MPFNVAFECQIREVADIPEYDVRPIDILPSLNNSPISPRALHIHLLVSSCSHWRAATSQRAKSPVNRSPVNPSSVSRSFDPGISSTRLTVSASWIVQKFTLTVRSLNSEACRLPVFLNTWLLSLPSKSNNYCAWCRWSVTHLSPRLNTQASK